jgi:hypothetical protein
LLFDKYSGEFEGQRPSFSNAGKKRTGLPQKKDLPRQRRICFTARKPAKTVANRRP